MKNYKQKLLILLLVLFASLGLSLGLEKAGAFTNFEARGLDWRHQMVGSQTAPSPELVLVMIDEASLQSMKSLVGRWPWPRGLYSDLIEFLTLSGAQAVLFDVLFSEPQVPRNELGELGVEDQALANMTLDSGIVIHAAQFLEDSLDESNQTLLNRDLPSGFSEQFALANFTTTKGAIIPKANNFYLPLTEFWQSSLATGIVEFQADSDGVYRRTWLLREYKGNYYPVLSLSLLNALTQPKAIHQDADSLNLDDIEIPLQADGSLWIKIRDDIPAYSIGGIFASIQKQRLGQLDEMIVKPEEFEGKIVIIGASAAGVEDLKTTALGKATPGVMLHASIIDSLLKKDWLVAAPTEVNLALALLFSLLCATITLFNTKPAIQSTVLLIFISLYVALSLLCFQRGYGLALVFPLVSIALSYFGAFAYISATDGKEKRKARKMLSQYVSPQVLSEVMDKSNKALTAEVGTMEDLSVLFSDIRGFTSLSEQMPPAQIVEMLNLYLKDMVDVVFDHQGTLDKFIGDAIMAFWGAPVKSEHHSLWAVESALEMQEKLIKINEFFDTKGWPHFKIGIGIHSGPVILGNIGSDKKLDYTVIGDNVNLASRLEGLTKFYGVGVLISETVKENLKGKLKCRILDAVKVKGKDQPIRIYEVLPKSQASQDHIVDLTEKAFTAYQTQDFTQAQKLYQDLAQTTNKDPLSQLFASRCQIFLDSPPAKDWDGTYSMETK